MAKSLPPLTWFRAFEAAARHLNFTAAGAEIGLTQSAVSQQVKALETRLRRPLFTRQARGLTLTDDGRRLLPQVTAALGTLADAALAFDSDPAQDVLTVATSVSIGQWVIAPHLPDLTKAHPNLRIRFLSAIWPDDFQSSRADVDIRFGSPKQAGPDPLPLRPNRLIALKSPLLNGPLKDLPLIEAVGTSAGWQAWAAQHGQLPPPTLFADTYGMALQLAAHGNGVALVSAALAGHAMQTGLVEQAHPGSIPGGEGYFLSINTPSPAASQFRDWLLAQLRRTASR